MVIHELKTVTKDVCNDLSNLLKQLRENPEEHVASVSNVRSIVGDANAILIVMKDQSRIIGMATLYILIKIGKRIAQVEDVVVDSSYRGQGLGEKLMRALIAIAKKKKIKTLNLTSRQSRVAANNLYQKLGFKHKETNVYRLKL